MTDFPDLSAQPDPAWLAQLRAAIRAEGIDLDTASPTPGCAGCEEPTKLHHTRCPFAVEEGHAYPAPPTRAEVVATTFGPDPASLAATAPPPGALF